VADDEEFQELLDMRRSVAEALDVAGLECTAVGVLEMDGEEVDGMRVRE
jgi:hypothetical protein